MAATAWSVLPPIITIVLALWTKEVYMSLIIGIFSGALLFTGGNILESILTMFTVMSDKVGSNVTSSYSSSSSASSSRPSAARARLAPTANGPRRPSRDSAVRSS